jgi:ribonuclease J
MYTAEILRATGNPNVPQAEWSQVHVFLPFFQKLRIKRASAFDVSGSYAGNRIFEKNLAEAAPRSVMLFRPSMKLDLEKANALSGARLICSLWSGYIDRAVDLMEWAARHGIPVERCHTSGHASSKDLVELRAAFPDAVVVPIHTDQPDGFAERFPNVRRAADGNWIEVADIVTPTSQG